MNKQIVVDTNVLIYAIDAQSKYFFDARNILNRSSDIFITLKSISEFYSVLSKNTNFDYAHIEVEVEKILISFQILLPSEESFAIFRNLVSKYKPRGNRVYDFEIISIALSHNINTIATFNKSDFQSITEVTQNKKMLRLGTKN